MEQGGIISVVRLQRQRTMPSSSIRASYIPSSANLSNQFSTEKQTTYLESLNEVLNINIDATRKLWDGVVGVSRSSRDTICKFTVLLG
jgi:hypothetical protein